VVVGDARHLRKTKEQFSPELSIRSISSMDQALYEPGTLDVLDLNNVPENLPMGCPSASGGKASVEYIRRAVQLAMDKKIQAITTAPINKEAMHLAGHYFPGHTELLADLTGVEESGLMLASDTLRVVLATTHVALSEVRPLITRVRVARTINLTYHWLRQVGIESPSIAVTGLNPHCGDGGIFGDEEKEHILPAITQKQQEGMTVSGPWPADALFGQIHKHNYDAVITMYHDQGMIPIKMASMGQAVNITLGLPIIRTSVDHGTAYDIAGEGIASPESLLNALRIAASLISTPVSA
jgi:4-hydroxythreonine-4-phosphate dehydrogenase